MKAEEIKKIEDENFAERHDPRFFNGGIVHLISYIRELQGEKKELRERLGEVLFETQPLGGCGCTKEEKCYRCEAHALLTWLEKWDEKATP